MFTPNPRAPFPGGWEWVGVTARNTAGARSS